MEIHLFEKYTRQIGVKGWDQNKLNNTNIMVLGAGALGNEIVKNLTLTGVNTILIVDFDHVELSNLSRTVLFSLADIGKSKAATLAAAARRLNPLANISYIHGDILTDVGLGFYRHADIIIGATDNIAARTHANTMARLAGRPYLDSGVWAYGGEVRWFFPSDNVCFSCTLSNKDRDDLHKRYSCTGFRQEPEQTGVNIIPSTLAPIAIIAGMVQQEVCHYLFGTRYISGGEVTVYNGLKLSIHQSILSGNPDCPDHDNHAYTDVCMLAEGIQTLTVSKLLNTARTDLGENLTLELGRDFLKDLVCYKCKKTEKINEPIVKVPESKSKCQVCGSKRRKNLCTAINSNDDLAMLQLKELGLRAGDIVVVHSEKGMRFYEMSHDIGTFRSKWIE